MYVYVCLPMHKDTACMADPIEYIHIYSYICTYKFLHIYLNVYICIYAYMYAYIYSYIYTCMYIHAPHWSRTLHAEL